MRSRRRNRPKLSAQEQMRRYVLIPLYMTWAFIGALMVHVLLARHPLRPWILTYCVVFVAHVVVSVLVLRGIALQELDGRRLPRWSIPALTATSVAACGVGIFLTVIDRSQLDFAFGPAILPLILTAWTMAPRLTWQWTLVTASVVGLLMVGFGWLVGVDIAGDPVFAARSLWLPTFVLLVVMMLTIRWSIIVTVTVKDQADMDAMRADLAVAEERLRIARDMHDVLGRTLTAVALKSDLAAGLAAAGRPEAAVKESKAVHQLADDALRELRGVLAGYRKTDLVTELAGAKGLLDSAGVSTRLIGDAREIPELATEPLSWVLREAATNIVRHSDASHCTIRLDSEPGRVALTVTNDGVRELGPRRFGLGRGVTPMSVEGEPDGSDVPGSGLASLRSRLEGKGATLDVERNGDSFVLVAWVPIGRDVLGDLEVPMSNEGGRE